MGGTPALGPVGIAPTPVLLLVLEAEGPVGILILSLSLPLSFSFLTSLSLVEAGPEEMLGLGLWAGLDTSDTEGAMVCSGRLSTLPQLEVSGRMWLSPPKEPLPLPLMPNPDPLGTGL